jgi:hypothetical protein
MPWPFESAQLRRAMTRARALGHALCALAFSALAGCSGTLDSIGGDASGGRPNAGSSRNAGASDAGSSGALTVPLPLTGPATYPNAFKDLLGKTDAEIDAKVSAAFAQLFHGDPDTEAIYVPVGTDQAYIHDVLHDDIRSEGISVGGIMYLMSVLVLSGQYRIY